jgi:hypothetical protein
VRHRRRPVHLAWLFLTLAVLSAWGCVKTNNASLPGNPAGATPPTPPTPTPAVTETFSGDLAVSGSAAFPFTVAVAGLVTATLTSLGPDSPIQIGLALGNWTGASCTVVIPNNSAVQGAVVSGTVSGAGTVCVGVYDVGNLQATLPFVITVVHP